jgi:hypothetical protein
MTIPGGRSAPRLSSSRIGSSPGWGQAREARAVSSRYRRKFTIQSSLIACQRESSAYRTAQECRSSALDDLPLFFPAASWASGQRSEAPRNSCPKQRRSFVHKLILQPGDTPARHDSKLSTAAIFLSGTDFWTPDAPAPVKHGPALGTLSPSGRGMAGVSPSVQVEPVTLGASYRLDATWRGGQRSALLDNLGGS